MKVTPSNHDPKVIARYYLEAVEACGGMFSPSSRYEMTLLKPIIIILNRLPNYSAM